MIPTWPAKGLRPLALLCAITLSIAGCRGAPTVDVSGSYVAINPSNGEEMHLALDTVFPDQSCTVLEDGFLFAGSLCRVYSTLAGKDFVDIEFTPNSGVYFRFRADPSSEDPTIADPLVLIGIAAFGTFEEFDPEEQFEFWRVE